VEIDKAFIKELHKPNVLLFWFDIALCALIGWGAFSFLIYTEYFYFKIIAFFISAFAIYRGQIFIHEVVHQRDAVKGLALFYELFFGWPNAYPSYFYDPHLYHHIPKEYATVDDPEYKSATNDSFIKLFIAPIVSAIFLPFILTIRFGVLPIFNIFLPRWWKLKVFTHAATLVVDIMYKRPLKKESELRSMLFNDFMCSLYRIVVGLLIYFSILPFSVVIYWVLLVSFVSLMNMYRAKMAHYYLGDGKSFSKTGQLLDSVTIEGNFFTELWAPLFLRYHAGHHLYPQMPYHSLQKLHRYLTSEEMKNHPYNQTVFKSFFAAAKYFINIDTETERKRVYI